MVGEIVSACTRVERPVISFAIARELLRLHRVESRVVVVLIRRGRGITPERRRRTFPVFRRIILASGNHHLPPLIASIWTAPSVRCVSTIIFVRHQLPAPIAHWILTCNPLAIKRTMLNFNPSSRNFIC